MKYAVIHCGTNNVDKHEPRDIADGLVNIGLSFRGTRRGSSVIIHGLLPRDFDALSHRRAKIREVNSIFRWI